MTFTSWQLVVGGLFLLPVTLLVEGGFPPLTTTNIIGFIYLGLVNTGFSYALWFRGIGKLPASAVTFLGLLVPIVATCIGWLLLDQQLTVVQLSGMAIILISVVMAQLVGRSREQHSLSTEPSFVQQSAD